MRTFRTRNVEICREREQVRNRFPPRGFDALVDRAMEFKKQHTEDSDNANPSTRAYQ